MIKDTDILIHPGRAFRNIARGIVPTVSGFDVDPSDLAKATNGDPTDPTGTGSTTRVGAGETGAVFLDLGSDKYVLVGGSIQLDSTTGTTNLKTGFKVDGGSAFEYSINLTSEFGMGEDRSQPIPIVSGYGRYIAMYGYVSAAATAYTEIFDLFALEINP